MKAFKFKLHVITQIAAAALLLSQPPMIHDLYMKHTSPAAAAAAAGGAAAAAPAPAGEGAGSPCNNPPTLAIPAGAGWPSCATGQTAGSGTCMAQCTNGATATGSTGAYCMDGTWYSYNGADLNCGGGGGGGGGKFGSECSFIVGQSDCVDLKLQHELHYHNVSGRRLQNSKPGGNALQQHLICLHHVLQLGLSGLELC
jgi:hypothetical protein